MHVDGEVIEWAGNCHHHAAFADGDGGRRLAIRGDHLRQAGRRRPRNPAPGFRQQVVAVVQIKRRRLADGGGRALRCLCLDFIIHLQLALV